MQSRKEFEISYDELPDQSEPQVVPPNVDALDPRLGDRIIGAYQGYEKKKALLEAFISGESEPIVSERIRQHELGIMGMETTRRFDQSVTLTSLSTDVHNALGIPRNLTQPSGERGSSGTATTRIDDIVKANYRSISKDYKKEASAEAKNALVGEDGILQSVVREVSTEHLARLKESFSRLDASFHEETVEPQNGPESKASRLGRHILNLAGLRSDRKDDAPRPKGLTVEQYEALAAMQSTLLSINESSIFNMVQDEYNVQKRGVAEAIIDRAVEQFKDDMKSGQLIDNLAHYVRSILERESFVKKTDGHNEEPRRRIHHPESSRNGFGEEVRRAVDSDITELNRKGYSIKKISMTLMRRYHPDLNGGDKDAEEKMKYFLSLGLQ